MNDLTDAQRERALELYRLYHYLKYGDESVVTDVSGMLPGTVRVWLGTEKRILQSHECKPAWRPTTRAEIQAGWEVRSRRCGGFEATWGIAHHQDIHGNWRTEAEIMLTTFANLEWTYETTAPEPVPVPDPRVEALAKELHDGSACKVVWPCESTADCYRKRAVDLLARLDALTTQP